MAKIHRVKQGETLYSIAHAEGFRRAEAIWEHESNAHLRGKRPSPSLLFPGDELLIPDRRVTPFACATRSLHTFRLRPSTRRFEQDLRNEHDEPLASIRYALDIDGTKFEGRTDGHGHLGHDVPADAKRGTLEAWLREGADEVKLSWTLDFGHLDPLEELSGVQGRLGNLGYDAGQADGHPSAATTAAISDFQSDHDLPATGELDDATRSKIGAAYGG